MIQILMLFLVVYMLARKTGRRVAPALAWTALPFAMAFIFGARHSSVYIGIASAGLMLMIGIYLVGSVINILAGPGKVRWGEPREDSLDEHTELFDEAVGIHRIHSVD